RWPELEGRPIERTAVVLARETERLGQATGPRAEEERVVEPTPRAHPVEPVRRLERPEERTHARPHPAADDVRAPVDAVRAIDVEVPGWPEHRPVPPGRAPKRVTRRIVRLVRLDLDEDPAHSVHEERRADERPRDRLDVVPGERLLERDL